MNACINITQYSSYKACLHKGIIKSINTFCRGSLQKIPHFLMKTVRI